MKIKKFGKKVTVPKNGCSKPIQVLLYLKNVLMTLTRIKEQSTNHRNNNECCKKCNNNRDANPGPLVSIPGFGICRCDAGIDDFLHQELLI